MAIINVIKFNGIQNRNWLVTYIPALVGFTEGIVYLTLSDQEFHRKYSR